MFKNFIFKNFIFKSYKYFMFQRFIYKTLQKLYYERFTKALFWKAFNIVKLQKFHVLFLNYYKNLHVFRAEKALYCLRVS